MYGELTVMLTRRSEQQAFIIFILFRKRKINDSMSHCFSAQGTARKRYLRWAATLKHSVWTGTL